MTTTLWLLIFTIASGEFHATVMGRSECMSIADDVAKGDRVTVKIDGGADVVVTSAWCLKPEKEEVPL